MRISKKTIALTFVALVLLGFFGTIVYQKFFTDDTAHAKSALQADRAAFASAAPNGNGASRSENGIKRAEVALNEYKKNVVEAPRGCNCGPEVDKYTEGNPGQWCTMFASWVANQAGTALIDPRNGSWRFSNSRLFTDYLKQFGTFYTRDEMLQKGVRPEVGDFVVFWRGNLEDNLGHIDVVVDAGGDPGSAGLVGGNIRDRVVYRENFPYLNYYGFLGFGRPEK